MPRPRDYKTWVHSQTQNKALWLAACEHVSASSQSLRFSLSLNNLWAWSQSQKIVSFSWQDPFYLFFSPVYPCRMGNIRRENCEWWIRFYEPMGGRHQQWGACCHFTNHSVLLSQLHINYYCRLPVCSVWNPGDYQLAGQWIWTGLSFRVSAR